MSRLVLFRPVSLTLEVALMSALVMAGLLASPLAHADNAHSPGTPSEQASDVSVGFHTSVQACTGRPVRRPLHSGQCVLLTAIGFLPGQKVLVREYRQPGWRQDSVANGRGSLTVQFRVPPTANATTDVLTFTGIEQTRPEPGSGTVAVSVPHAAAYRFLRVR